MAMIKRLGMFDRLAGLKHDAWVQTPERFRALRNAAFENQRGERAPQVSCLGEKFDSAAAYIYCGGRDSIQPARRICPFALCKEPLDSVGDQHECKRDGNQASRQEQLMHWRRFERPLPKAESDLVASLTRKRGQVPLLDQIPATSS